MVFLDFPVLMSMTFSFSSFFSSYPASLSAWNTCLMSEIVLWISLISLSEELSLVVRTDAETKRRFLPRTIFLRGMSIGSQIDFVKCWGWGKSWEYLVWFWFPHSNRKLGGIAISFFGVVFA